MSSEHGADVSAHDGLSPDVLSHDVPSQDVVERIWRNVDVATSRLRRRHRATLLAVVSAVIGVGIFFGGAAFGATHWTGSTPNGSTTVRVVTPSSTISWADASATLVPLSHPAPWLISADHALDAVRSGLASVQRDGDPAGPTTAALYLYSNSVYGQIRADGSVDLSYVNRPVWEIATPLSKYIDDSQGGKPAPGTSPRTPAYTNCVYYYLVDAESGTFITSGQECAARATH